MSDSVNSTFDELYRQYFTRSVRFLRSYLHSSQAAEDIASECLIKLWEKMNTSGVKEVQAYLFVVLKNRALDYLKHEAIHQTAVNGISAQLTREREIRISTLESLDPQDIFSAEIHRILHQTLEELPQKTKLIFMMSRFEGLSQKEIAQQFGISVKGVDYQVSKALSTLRKALKDYLPILQFFFIYFN
jgi:RNA polymerase sigma-70 factor (ECF subfamily)